MRIVQKKTNNENIDEGYVSLKTPGFNPRFSKSTLINIRIIGQF